VLTFFTVHEVDTEPGRRQVAEAQAIFRESFPTIPEEADTIPTLVKNQRQLGYDVRLLVAEKSGHVAGFAIIFYFPECGFAYLDYIATGARDHGGGLGTALYDGVRDTARHFGARGLFLEVRPDDRSVHDTDTQYQDAVKRLRFYEKLHVLPVTGTDYDKPVRPGGDYSLLLYDGLGRERPLRAGELKSALAAILIHKYHLPPTDPQHIAYLRSIRRDPIVLRAPKYVKEDVALLLPGVDGQPPPSMWSKPSACSSTGCRGRASPISATGTVCDDIAWGIGMPSAVQRSLSSSDSLNSASDRLIAKKLRLAVEIRKGAARAAADSILRKAAAISITSMGMPNTP